MYRIALAGLLPVVCAAVGGAQNQPIYSETDFLSALDASHPAVTVSAEDPALAEARLVEASLLDNPAVDVVREEPSGSVEQTDLLVTWQLPEPGRRAEIEARREESGAASSRYTQRLRTVRLEMREVYATWALAAAREERLVAQAERVGALAERESARAARGESSGLEADRLALAAETLRSRAALAGAARDRGLAEAALWVPALPREARPAVPDLPPPPSFDADHPLVRAAAADLEAARLGAEAARRFLASPALTVGWQRQESASEALEGPVLGISWSVPLFDRGQSERAAAEARIAGSEARLELTRREVEASRRAARASFDRLARALTAARAGLVESERTLDAAEAAFRFGETALTDLLETHRAVTEAALAVLDLQGAALAAHRELERLAAPDAALEALQPTDSTPRETHP